MHECPICGQICDCDGDDFFHDKSPQYCACDCEEQAERWDGMEDFANEKLEEFGCLYGAACCMPGLHFPSECHTAEMLEAEFAEQTLELDREKAGRVLV